MVNHPRLLLLSALLGGACAPEPPAGPVDLALAEAWALVPAADDPFGPPEGVVCSPRGVVVETGVIEIQTDLCPWATLRQPLQADAAAGDALELFAFHGPLAAPEPAAGVMALTLGGEPIWSVEVPIPWPDGVYLETWTAEEPWAAGEELLLHVHNHGANAWRFAWLRATGG